MQQEHLQQLKHLDEQLDGLEVRFSNHLEVYANNGKELARLGDLISNHIGEQKKMMEDLFPIIDFYRSFKVTSRVTQVTFKGVMKITGIILAIGSTYLIIKTILHR